MVSLEYISVPSPNGARPIYRSADCVIRHEGGWGLTIARVPAGRDRDRDRIRTMSATNGESFRLQLEETFLAVTSRNVGWGSPLGTGAVDLYPPVSFGVVERMDSEFEDYTERDCCGVRYRVTCWRKDRSGRHVNSIEEEDSPFAIIRSSTDRLWD